MRFLSYYLLFDAAGGDGSGGGGGGAPPAPPAPSPASLSTYLGNDGSLKPGWATAVGLDPKNFDKFTSLEGFAKSYQNLSGMLSNEKIPIPKAGASEDEWASVWAKLGRPEKASDYEYKKPDDLPAELWNAKRYEEFSALAHKLGLNQKQFTAILGNETARVKELYTEALGAKDRCIGQLRNEWGAQTESKMDAAARTLEQLGGKELLSDASVANNPAFIKFLANVSDVLSESGTPGLRGEALAQSQTLETRLKSIMSDRSHAFWNRGPLHDAAVSEVAELRRQLSLLKR